jgi:hypothetical protein
MTIGEPKPGTPIPFIDLLGLRRWCPKVEEESSGEVIADVLASDETPKEDHTGPAGATVLRGSFFEFSIPQGLRELGCPAIEIL